MEHRNGHRHIPVGPVEERSTLLRCDRATTAGDTQHGTTTSRVDTKPRQKLLSEPRSRVGSVCSS
jgi:hypothetical protein